MVMYHGISREHAGSIMHDTNHYAHPVAERVVAMMNTRGGLARVVQDALVSQQMKDADIARHSPRVAGHHVTSFSRLLAAAAGAAAGGDALRNGGVSKAISKFNSDGATFDVQGVAAFLVHLLKLAKANHAVGTAHASVWSLAGVMFNRNGHLVSEQEFLSGNKAVETKGAVKTSVMARASTAMGVAA